LSQQRIGRARLAEKSRWFSETVAVRLMKITADALCAGNTAHGHG